MGENMNKGVQLELTIGKHMVKVSDEHLFGYNHIRKVSLAKEVQFLPIAAFRYRKDLVKIYFEPRSELKKIPEHCFDHCEKLKKIQNLPENLVSIEQKAFSCCTSIEVFEIPQSVEFVDPSAFDGWKENQIIKMYKKFHLSSLCNAKTICQNDEATKKNRIITHKNDDSLKPFIVRTKCGHVTRHYYIEIAFAIKAKNACEAAAVARQIGRVKHHHKFAIIEVRAVSQNDFDRQIEINDNDPYLKVKSKREQNEIWEFIKDRLVSETNIPIRRK